MSANEHDDDGIGIIIWLLLFIYTGCSCCYVLFVSATTAVAPAFSDPITTGTRVWARARTYRTLAHVCIRCYLYAREQRANDAPRGHEKVTVTTTAALCLWDTRPPRARKTYGAKAAFFFA